MKKSNKLIYLLVTLLPFYSYATLGGDSSTIAADNRALASIVSNVVTTSSINNGYTVSSIKTTDNHTITEYTSSNGKVFCVTWKGRSYPKFSQILGSDSSQLKSANKTSKTMTSSNNITGKDFVFTQSGIPGMLSGRACKPSLVPANINVNNLK